MPELPEVQCVVNTLQKIKNKKITKIKILTPKLREPLKESLHKELVGKEIMNIDRRGKYIILTLSKGFLVVHLGMTGKFVVNVEGDKFDRLQIELDDGTRLVYNDIRKFGFVMYENSLMDNKYVNKLGIEPLSDDLNGDVLFSLAKDSRKNIKQFLLDQHIIVGLGNIYVIEVMYLTKINPLIKANELSLEKAKELSANIKSLLKKSIELGGSSISDYRDADNKKGSFQDTFNVYGKKEDKEGRKVEQITQNGRSTYYCPEVQK